MKRILSFILSLVIVLSLCSCSLVRGKIFTKSFLDLFDTACSISAFDESQESFNAKFDIVYKELKRYSDLLDIYKISDGNLASLNFNQSLDKPDKIITDILKMGKIAYENTNGKVNIAMGSVLSIWHEKRELKDNNELPSMEELRSASRHTDIDKICHRDAEITLADVDMSVDVGAIAKGFVCERITEFILNNNIWESAVLSIGGNIKTIGTKNNDGRSFFNISVENPFSSEGLCTVKVNNGISVVTSGDYQRYFEIDGHRYCHIIDNATLMPSEYFSSVTVICDDSFKADYMSTYLFLLPLDKGLEIIDNDASIEAMWLDKEQRITYSKGFEDFIN